MDIPPKILKNLWLFARGDTSVKDFEKWVYSSSELEYILSSELYMNLISHNFNDQSANFVLKKNIKTFLDSRFQRACECHTLPYLADLSMGTQPWKEFRKTVKQKASYGEPLWWLWFGKCNICSQGWLVASDERINDVDIMRRLSHTEMEKILSANDWPDDFSDFSELLRIGKDKGHGWRFLDPVSSALIATVIDLAKAKPGICLEEIAELLQIGVAQALDVTNEALKEEKLNIRFPL